MGWLRLAGSLKTHVSFAEYCLFCRALVQKRLVILSILLSKATPYARAVSCMGCVFLTAAVSRMWWVVFMCVVFMAPAVSRMGCVFQEGRMWCVVFIRGVAYVVCCIHSCMSRMWCVVFIHVCRIHGALRIVSNEKDEKDTRHTRHRCRICPVLDRR